VLVPPVIEAILSAPDNRVQAFLAAGHVCAVVGYEDYEPLARKYQIPFVVTGFEPLDIMQGIYMCVKQLEEGRTEVENQYARCVRREGNQPAREIVREVFTIVDRKWRGIGEISSSGLGLREPYIHFDAETRFDLADYSVEESDKCISRTVLRGIKSPLNVLLLELCVHRNIHLAQRWFPARVHVRLIIATEGHNLWRHRHESFPYQSTNIDYRRSLHLPHTNLRVPEGASCTRQRRQADAQPDRKNDRASFP
jgi:hypothetical protein